MLLSGSEEVDIDLTELQVVREPRTKMDGSSDRGDFQSDLLGEHFFCLFAYSIILLAEINGKGSKWESKCCL